ncbi:hypothetical protein [Aquimarina megaterium]|uniref:hypothetical protein n=1 Tax=Aquimarina megaterium TaxID=1443666 RepID=UPI0004708610|nr:hypothetical protein [Aquimarina megaterium]
MSIIQSIELFTAINLGIVGLSHFLQPGMWVEFFQFLSTKKHVGNIFNALLTLGVGSIILSFHFIWSWPKILITVYGLLLVIKGLIYMLIPSIGIASIAKVTIEKGYKFRWVGLIMFIFSLLILYGLIIEGAF